MMYPSSIDTYESGPVYVLNKSNGDVIFHLKDNAVIIVPRTFIPIDVTTQAPLNDLKESRDFRTVLNKGLFVFITKEEAEALLTKPSYVNELNRVRKTYFSAASSSLAGLDNDVAKTELLNNEEVSPKIRDIMISKDSDADKIEKIEFEYNLEMLTQSDVNFILKSTDPSSKLYKHVIKYKEIENE